MTWTTLLRPNNSFVEFGVSGGLLDNKVPASTSRYVACGRGKRVIYIHKVKLTGLLPSTSYGMTTFINFNVHSYNTVVKRLHWSMNRGHLEPADPQVIFY